MDLRKIGNTGGLAAGQPSVAPTKQIRAQMQRMHSAIERLEVLVPVLAEALTPVLNVETQKETGKEGRAPYTTPLADAIAHCSERVDNVVYALNQILDRVEL